MNELAHSVSLLYSTDSAPVVAVSGGLILFFNDAAHAFFPEIAEGLRASDILPAPFLRCDEEHFVSAARVHSRSVSASGVWYGGMLLLRLDLTPATYEFAPEPFTAGMRAELAAIRISLEQMTSEPAALSDRQRSSVAVLRHAYYKLLRRCENTALACNLASRSAVYRPLLMDPAEWLAKLVEQLRDPAEKLGVKLRFTRPANAGQIPADSALLEKLLLNLVANALRHLKPGGVIAFRMSRQGRRLLLAVDDNGPGFSDEQLRGLYRRSVLRDQTSAFRSDCLGLLIVWGVADLHGGAVTITNRSKGGASVRVMLPTEHENYLRSPTEPYKSRLPENEYILTELAEVLPDACYPPA